MKRNGFMGSLAGLLSLMLQADQKYGKGLTADNSGSHKIKQYAGSTGHTGGSNQRQQRKAWRQAPHTRPQANRR